MEKENYRHHGSSFFFPIALITVGVVWLLVNNGTIAPETLYRLIPLWPVVLIGGGLSLILRRLWWPLAAIMWMALAAGIVWALVAAPTMLPKADPINLRHEVLSEPLGSAKSASVKLNLSVNSTKIHGLQDKKDLLVADIYVADKAVLDASGNEMKNVVLQDASFEGVQFFNYSWITAADQPWDIGLTTAIPLKLELDASTGSTAVDLTGIMLEELNIKGSTGSMSITLPGDQQDIPFTMDASTGSLVVKVPQNTGVKLDLRASTGSVTMTIPDGAGLQVDVTESGLGSLSLPKNMEKISGDKDEKKGLYENAAFKTASRKIAIKLDMSTGSVTIR